MLHLAQKIRTSFFVCLLCLAPGLGCWNQPIDTDCTTLQCVHAACANTKGHFVCAADTPGCDPAEEALSFMQFWKDEMGIPKSAIECGLFGEGNPWERWNACETAALNYVYRDEVPDPDFDPCLEQGSPGAYGDYETTLAEWRSDCEAELSTNGSPPPMAAGICSDSGIKALVMIIGFPEWSLYFEAESGEFLASEVSTEFPFYGCGSTYWPMNISCPFVEITEVICGDSFRLGEVWEPFSEVRGSLTCQREH